MQVLITMPKFMDRHCMILDLAICGGSRRQGLAVAARGFGVGRSSSRAAPEHGAAAEAAEHGAAAEAAERLLRSQPKACSKCASPVRPAPCHACCMKQTPRDSSLRIVVSPLFDSSPRPKRPSPPGVYFLCHLFMVAGAATSERFSVPPPPRERPIPLPLHRLPSHAPL